jgi:hypothetical protein
LRFPKEQPFLTAYGASRLEPQPQQALRLLLREADRQLERRSRLQRQRFATMPLSSDKNFKCWIQTGDAATGAKVEEYKVEHSGNTTSCYIESKEGENFAVRSRRMAV